MPDEDTAATGGRRGREREALMESAELDAWLPAPAIRTRHRRTAAAGPGRLWKAAGGVRLDDTRTVGRLVRWRIPGTTGDSTFRDLLSTYPFTVLEEAEHRLVSGLCGRIWTTSRDYPVLAGADDFRRWDAPGTARVLFAHWAEPAGPGRSALVSEARVEPVDRRADVALRALWVVVGRFERLIGAEPLSLACARAEQ
jgi:hypothetical protein